LSVAGGDYRAVRMWGNALTPSIATLWMVVIILVELSLGGVANMGLDI
jgi:hypothetical protein